MLLTVFKKEFPFLTDTSLAVDAPLPYPSFQGERMATPLSMVFRQKRALPDYEFSVPEQLQDAFFALSERLNVTGMLRIKSEPNIIVDF